MNQVQSSSPSSNPANHSLNSKKQSSSSHRNLTSIESPSHPHKSSPASLIPNQPNSPNLRSIQNSTASQTSPTPWSVSGKSVRKKASGLFREAARSWGRSKSKEVLSFGLGVLIGNQDSSTNQQPSHNIITTSTTHSNNIHSNLTSNSKLSPQLFNSNQSQLPQTPEKFHLNQSHSTPLGIMIKGPKKRISFHPPKKSKSKSNENSKLIKRRSEIAFGDWADTLNTAVASSSPHPFPVDKSNQTSQSSIIAQQPPHPGPTLNHSISSGQLSTHSSDPMAIPIRRRDRSFHVTHNVTTSTPVEVESFSLATTSRVPRSTFPHAPRSPRSPRRFYNTRSAVHRNQTSLISNHDPLFALQTSTPLAHTNYLALNQYQPSIPFSASPFKRSVSPINQFEDDFDLESPIASKSLGRAPPNSDFQLRSASSARANLFGAMPNRSGGLEPSSSYDPISNSSTPQAAQSTSCLPMCNETNSTHTASLPRSRQRTVSATLQEHSTLSQAQHKINQASPSSSPSSRDPFQDLSHPNPSSSGTSHKTIPQNTRIHQAERWVMPRIEGLDMTPRRPSLDESGEDSDPAESVNQAESSKPSSTTSIFSILNTHQITSGPLNKPNLGGFDAFGALPPPESPFPGPPRIRRAAPTTASPNKLKRDVDGEIVGFTSQPNLYRHRRNAQTPSCSLPSLRLKTNPFDSIQTSQRNSWGQQSNCISDEDVDEPQVVDRDAISASHESHEGTTSNLSVPGLTDSSSLASSLASSLTSSNQCNNNAHNAPTPTVDSATSISTTWDNSSKETDRDTKRRSLPTNVGLTPQKLTPVPPLPIGLVSTPLSAKRYLLPSPAPLIQSTDLSFQENETSYQNVKPNASAFLSSGLKSKKTVPRDRTEHSFSSSSLLVQYVLLNISDPNASLLTTNKNVSVEDSIATESMCEALGGSRVILATMQQEEADQQSLMEHDDQSRSMHLAPDACSPSDSSLGIILPDCLRNSSLRMPDTPIKKPFTMPKSHPHVNKPLIPSGLSRQSNAFSPSFNVYPVDNSPISPCHQFVVPESPIPHSQKSNSHSLISTMTPKLTATSPQRNPDDESNPSPSSNRSSLLRHIPSVLSSLSKHSPVFRRRPSDPTLTKNAGCSNLAKTSDSQNNNPFDEAGTPTKVATGWLKRVPQLMTSPSPGSSICSVTNSPSMHHRLQVDQLISGNSSLEHLVDPQVTPNRTGARSYTSLIKSPTSDAEIMQDSSANLTPGRDYSASPSTHHLSFSNRYSSPTIDDNQRKSLGPLSDSPSGGRFESSFDIFTKIGCGEFGEVYRARLCRTGQFYAVKRAKRTATGPKALERQHEEIEILRLLTEASDSSPYIIRLADSWQEFNRWYIQAEYCANDNLERFLELIARLQDRVDEERIWKIVSELAQAIAFMHSCGVLHLDIKPANIFITALGGLKVGDFGLARRWPRINPNEVRECGFLNGRHKVYQHYPKNPTDQGSDSMVPSRFLRYEDVSDNEERHMMRFKSCGRFVGFDLEREGDREYIAPEILSGRYGEEADVFSMGLIALEISTNVVLPDNGDEWRGLRSSDFSRTDLSHLSSELVLLIKRMMDKSPDRRITAAELIQHPVLSKLNSLRLVGIAEESERMMIETNVNAGQTGVLNNRHDDTGDIQMAPFDDVLKEPIEPLRPDPPPNNLWRSARGAVLPEAKGFLPFILTGQSTPSRMKLSQDKALAKVKVNDAMEIDS